MGYEVRVGKTGQHASNPDEPAVTIIVRGAQDIASLIAVLHAAPPGSPAARAGAEAARRLKHLLSDHAPTGDPADLNAAFEQWAVEVPGLPIVPSASEALERLTLAFMPPGSRLVHRINGGSWIPVDDDGAGGSRAE